MRSASSRGAASAFGSTFCWTAPAVLRACLTRLCSTAAECCQLQAPQVAAGLLRHKQLLSDCLRGFDEAQLTTQGLTVTATTRQHAPCRPGQRNGVRPQTCQLSRSWWRRTGAPCRCRRPRSRRSSRSSPLQPGESPAGVSPRLLQGREHTARRLQCFGASSEAAKLSDRHTICIAALRGAAG